MAVIFSPVQFVSSGAYFVQQYRGLEAVLQSAFRAVHPRATCLGTLADLDACRAAAEAGVPVVTCDPQAYFSGLHKTDRITFIPVAEMNATSFWHYGHIVYGNMRIGQGHISLTDYLTIAVAGRALQQSPQGFDFQRKDIPFFEPEWVRSLTNDIMAVRRRMGDQRSRDAFMRMVYCDMTAGLDYFLSAVLRRTQYFDYLQLRGGERIINCGVDNGWELPFLLAATDNNVRVYNIDPCGDTCLTPYARQFADFAGDRFTFHPMAVWDRPTNLSFHDKVTRAVDHADEADGELVKAISIDEFCKQNAIDRVDVIKMDLEGAEPHAIAGMMETVRTHRPQLAISIYHSVRQMLEIPIQLSKSLTDYHFYLDTHNFDFRETVFYAIPKEKDRFEGDVLIVD